MYCQYLSMGPVWFSLESTQCLSGQPKEQYFITWAILDPQPGAIGIPVIFLQLQVNDGYSPGVPCNSDRKVAAGAQDRVSAVYRSFPSTWERV